MKTKLAKTNNPRLLMVVLLPMCLLAYSTSIKANSPIENNEDAKTNSNAVKGTFDNWLYLNEITVDNSGNSATLTDYSILVILNTANLINQGKMNTDGSDIRFTTDYINDLSYWIDPGIQNEHGINTDSTHIWVKVPQIQGLIASKMYLLYGNASALSKSNIGETFLFGDDFDDNSLDTIKWDAILDNQGQILEQNQRLEHNSPRTSPQSNSNLFSKQQFTGPMVLEMQFKKGGYVYRSAGLSKGYGSNYNVAYCQWQDWGSFSGGVFVSGVQTDVNFRDDSWSYVNNPEYYLKIIRNEDGTFTFSEKVPSFEPGGPQSWFAHPDAPMSLDSTLKIFAYEGVWSSSPSLQTRYEDNIRVRKYSNPEPTTTVSADQLIFPIITTSDVSNITTISATSGGNITYEGGSSVIQRGIVWNTTLNPSLENNLGQTTDSMGTGPFISNLTNLISSTTYYVRAYATNSNGTAYGLNQKFITVSDSLTTNVTLIDLTVNGTAIDNFSPEMLNYLIFLPAGTVEIPPIGYVAFNPNATVSIINPVSLWGKTRQERSYQITVISQDGSNSQTYWVEFYLISNDAVLSGVKINQVDLPGFYPDITNYQYELPAGTIQNPEITYQTAVEGVTVQIKNATNLFGTEQEQTATITVTSIDGKSVTTYSILFSVKGLDIQLPKEKEIVLFPSPAGNRLAVQNLNNAQTIRIYNLSGQLEQEIMVNHQQNLNFDISNLSSGLHILRVISASRTENLKFVKQ